MQRGGGSTLPDVETVERTLAVHLVGTINMIRSAMPIFLQQKYGRIVNTGSGSILGIPWTGSYAAGKGGVLAHAKVLANELLAEMGEDPSLDIRVNVVMATTEGWQAPDDEPTPEDILEHWDELRSPDSSLFE